jgi:hypothetical protein
VVDEAFESAFAGLLYEMAESSEDVHGRNEERYGTGRDQ